jgi:adhesin transport system outer membrane protein
MLEPGTIHRLKKLSGKLLLCISIMAPASVAQGQTSLQDVVQRALEHNPEMQVAWHDFLAAGHDTDAARAGFRPQIAANAGYGRQRENYITGRPMNTGVAEVTLRQLLWDGARTTAYAEEFGAIELISYFEMLESGENTALEAFRAYQDVLRQRELLRLAEENLESHRGVFDQIAESAEAGVARTADLEQISGRQALAETNVITERSNLHDVTARYLRIVGEMPSQQLAGYELEHGLPSNISDTLMQAYQHSPRYHATLRNIAAAEASTRARDAEFRPRLNLTARYGIQDRDEFGFRESHSDGRIGVELTYDLYTGGRRNANTRRAYEVENSARSLRDRACVDIRQTVQIAFNDMNRLAEQLPILNQHRLSSDRVRTAYKQQFDIGDRTLLDVLDSENEYYDASRAWTNASYDRDIAAARTLAAMGLLLETLRVGREDMPSLSELGAEPIPVDPATACPTYDIYDSIRR